jgi:hypothetical protein
MTPGNAHFCMTMLRDMPDAVIHADAKGRACLWSAARR